MLMESKTEIIPLIFDQRSRNWWRKSAWMVKKCTCIVFSGATCTSGRGQAFGTWGLISEASTLICLVLCPFSSRVCFCSWCVRSVQCFQCFQCSRCYQYFRWFKYSRWQFSKWAAVQVEAPWIYKNSSLPLNACKPLVKINLPLWVVVRLKIKLAIGHDYDADFGILQLP